MSAKGRAISLTAALWILFLLERLGVLTSTFWSAVTRGDVAGAMEQLRGSMQANFMTGLGASVTLSGAISLAIVTAAIRWVAKGRSVSLRRPSRITA